MKRLFRGCGHAPGALSPEDQAAVDQFRALLAALRDPEPWTPGQCQDLAVRAPSTSTGPAHATSRSPTRDEVTP
ncbi:MULTISPECIES: hypothetical protein [unclassified Streptomyces]|uniref:hypothetical protein n=1 Tax=unclassified Streptomyces TaxID=2593676 RepID=UPI002FF3A7E2